MTLPPIWLTADAQALDLPGLNIPFQQLVTATGDAVRAVTDPVVDYNRRAQEAVTRVKDWYAERIDDAVAPVENLAEAAAGFLEDTWATGVHLYMPYPDFGGLPELNRALTQALSSPDPDAPRFSDEMYAGGALMVVAGGRMQVLAAAAGLLALMGGDASRIQQALMGMFTVSNPIAEVAEGAMAIVANAPATWNAQQQQFMDIFNQSHIKQFLDGGFPGSLIEDAGAPQGVLAEPEQAERGKPFTVKIQVKGVGRAGVGVSAGGLAAPTVQIKGPHEIWAEFDAASWERMAPDENGSYAVSLLAGGQAQQVLAMEALPGSILDRLGESTVGGQPFAEWKALTVGSAVNAVVPGAAQMASRATQTMENLGVAARSGGNVVTAGLDAVANTVAATAQDVANFADNIDASAAGFLDELGKISVSTLLIPPGKGGIHQLNFALGQGLSAYAPNAPLVTEDQMCLGLFVVAGAGSAVEVVASLKRFGATLGIPALAQID